MNKKSRRQEEELRADYDFASMRDGVRGKYFERYQDGTKIIRVEQSNRGPSTPRSQNRERSAQNDKV